MVAAFECETGGILDNWVERNIVRSSSSTQLSMTARSTAGVRSATTTSRSRSDSAPRPPQTRPEGIDVLQANVDSDALKPCADRGVDARQCLSCGCIPQTGHPLRPDRAAWH